MYIESDKRLNSLKPFRTRLWLSSPTMHGDEQKWVDEAIRTNWVSTVGENIDTVEKQMAQYLGVGNAVALSCGTAGKGYWDNKKVFSVISAKLQANGL